MAKMKHYLITEETDFGQEILDLIGALGNINGTGEPITKAQIIEELTYVIWNARRIKNEIKTNKDYLNDYEITEEE